MIASPRSLDETSLVHGRLWSIGAAWVVVLDSLWRGRRPIVPEPGRDGDGVSAQDTFLELVSVI